MEDFNEFYNRFLKSYVPFVLPILFLYAIESDSSLKLWHAVQQIPHLEKEAAANDTESNVDAARQAEIVATRQAIKREARRERIGRISLILILVAVFLFEQYAIFSGMLIRAREEDDFEDYGIITDPEEYRTESVEGYNWYYNSTHGRINWTKLYYPITLFFPAIILTTRALYLLSGLKNRVVLRDARGRPFMLLVPTDRFKLRRSTLAVVAVSSLLVHGAFWFHNVLCSVIVYTSTIHYIISYVTVPDCESEIKVIRVVLLLFLPAMIPNVFAFEFTKVFLPYTAAPVDSIYWSALIYTSLFCVECFNIISLCYRMDYAIACPGTFLVGPPDIKFMAQTLLEVPGTRLSYVSSRVPSTPRPCFRKPYFHTAIWTCLGVYALVAVLGAVGYSWRAESAGVYAAIVMPSYMCMAVALRAVVRGEVKKLWMYKEDWVRNPSADGHGQSASVIGESRVCELEAKSSVAGENEKIVLQV